MARAWFVPAFSRRPEDQRNRMELATAARRCSFADDSLSVAFNSAERRAVTHARFAKSAVNRAMFVCERDLLRRLLPYLAPDSRSRDVK